MINWTSIKKAAETSIERIPLDDATLLPSDRRDDVLLRKALRLAASASGERLTREDVNAEMTKAVTRGVPYRIMSDGVPVGAAVTGHFSHYDPEAKTDYHGQSVNDLAVIPEYQNKGVGKEALRLLIKEMLKDRPKWLHIAYANSNDRATHVYREMGFGHPMAWDDKATSLHMKRGEAKRLLKEWEKKKSANP